jgi:cysteine synthase A
VLAKIEGRNPAYSVKCRIGAAMVWDAEKRGLLGPGKELVEPTSGNTGIALAFVAAARGYKLTLTMPETMSIERRKLLVAYGAKLVLTEGPKGMSGAIAKAEEIAASDPSRYVLLQQFKNPANPAIHETTTGPEIWDATDGASMSSSRASAPAAPSPASRATSRNSASKPLHSVAVEPTTSPVITQRLAGEPNKPAPHKIQGIGAGFVPDVLDLSSSIRSSRSPTTRPSHFARRLAREEGILQRHLLRRGGGRRRAPRQAPREHAGKTIVVVLPDSGERYLSSVLFEGIFDAQGSGAVSGGGTDVEPGRSLASVVDELCRANDTLLGTRRRKLGRRLLPSREAVASHRPRPDRGLLPRTLRRCRTSPTRACTTSSDTRSTRR